MDDELKPGGAVPAARAKVAAPRAAWSSVTAAVKTPPPPDAADIAAEAADEPEEQRTDANGSYTLFKLTRRYEMPELELRLLTGQKHGFPYMLIDWKDFDGDKLIIYHPRFTATLKGRNLAAIYEELLRKRVKRIWQVHPMKDPFDANAAVVYDIAVGPTK